VVSLSNLIKNWEVLKKSVASEKKKATSEMQRGKNSLLGL
jgi:hypothetical protein